MWPCSHPEVMNLPPHSLTHTHTHTHTHACTHTHTFSHMGALAEVPPDFTVKPLLSLTFAILHSFCTVFHWFLCLFFPNTIFTTAQNLTGNELNMIETSEKCNIHMTCTLLYVYVYIMMTAAGPQSFIAFVKVLVFIPFFYQRFLVDDIW